MDDVVVVEAAETWSMASASRMLARNWLPSPSPLAAPFDEAGDVDQFDQRREIDFCGSMSSS